MTKSSIAFFCLGLTILLWGLNYLALKFYLFWTIGWYDFLMHFLGGMVITLLAFGLFNLAGIKLRSFLAVFVLAMAVSVVWEIFEYIYDIAGAIEGYAKDTTYDLLMDILGIIAAYFVISRSRESS